MKATSTPSGTAWFFSQSKMAVTSCSFTWKLSQFLTADSSNTRIENGNLSVKKKIRKITEHNVWILLNCVTTEKDGSNIAIRNGGYNIANRDGNNRWLVKQEDII